jgi:hypothetical protein
VEEAVGLLLDVLDGGVTFTYTYMHIYIHTYIHTYTQNVVEEAVGLLLDVLDGGDTSTVRKLYKTGIYFFALSYSGSNLSAIAKVSIHMCVHVISQIRNKNLCMNG